MINYNKIESKAKEILNKFDLMNSPIDVEELSLKLNVKIEEQNLDDGISGFLVKKKDKNIIGLNIFHPEVRQRFTIAHEIGHLILHRETPLFVDYYKGSMINQSENKKLYRRDKGSYHNHKHEKEANAFAASLLMPKILIKKELNKLNDNFEYDEIVNKLSRKFIVSSQAMDYRLKSLGYYDYGF